MSNRLGNHQPEEGGQFTYSTVHASGSHMDSLHQSGAGGGGTSPTRCNSLEDEIDGTRKQLLSGGSKKVLRKAKSLFCCLHPNVQLDEEAGGGGVLAFQQCNGGSSPAVPSGGSQKPVPRVYPSPESYDFIIGPKSKQDLTKKTLVLDLDETLVHSSFDCVLNHDYIIPVNIDGQVKDVYVQKRPWLDHFLTSLSKYADPLLDLLDSAGTIRWRLFRDACSTHKGVFVKDLIRLGRDLSQTIIIDNSPLSYAFQPGNAVPITGFVGDQTDRALLDILPILEELADTSDVRECIKRNLGESTAILAAADNISRPTTTTVNKD
eukprot:g8044.t1